MSRLFVLSLLAVSWAAPGWSQEAPQTAAITAKHELLKQFVGHWESKAECNFGPDAGLVESSGTIDSKMIGGLWMVSDLQIKMPGMDMTGQMTLGYDPEKDLYVGTWVDSVMNHIWHYKGTVDESGTRFTLNASGPAMDGSDTPTDYRDIYDFVADGEIKTTSLTRTADGEWVTFMTGESTRTSKSP